jgi:hypothetical protein
MACPKMGALLLGRKELCIQGVCFVITQQR